MVTRPHGPLGRWLAANISLVVALYVGVWGSIDWLTLLVAAFVWIMLAAYAAAYLSPKPKQLIDPAPRWLGPIIDALVLFAFAAHAWYLTALAYLASALILRLIYRRSTEKRAASDTERSVAFESEFQVAKQTADRLVPLLASRTTDELHYADVRHDDGADYLLGFVSSAADVVAQSLGGKSGGAGSMNGTLQTLNAIFGDQRFEPFFQRCLQLHDTPTTEFSAGFHVGTRWANFALGAEDADARRHAVNALRSRYAREAHK
jgi:hypothetical protein